MIEPIRTKHYDYGRGYRTPWGEAQTAYTYAEGVVFYSCAGHGGVKVNKPLNRLIPEPLRNEDGWYEEDCESRIPWYFLLHDEGSAEPIKHYWPDEWTAATGERLEVWQSRELQRRAFVKTNAGRPLVVSAFGAWADWVPEGKVGVKARIGGRGNPHGAESRWLIPKDEYRAGGDSGFGFVVDPERHERVA
ncbi:MAG: hypothetical protein R3324_02635 [Halobacteriales archaeon]|nr:hypothetical protein [Halobacteriales archaeon]